MKKLTALTLLHCFCSILFAQAPNWSRYISSDLNRWTNGPLVFDGKQTRDKGYIMAGFLSDTSRFPTPKQAVSQKLYQNHSQSWLVKTDSLGARIWEVSSSNYSDLAFSSVDTCQDGGYIVAGSRKVSNPYPQLPDPSQFLIVKYSSTGSLLWTKSYGGSKEDKANCIKQTRDGGYIVVGYTESDNGDVTNRQGPNTDAWMLRLDTNGNIIWKNCFGGSGADTAYSVVETNQNDFVVVGSTTSDFGSTASNQGLVDGWIMKISSTGHLLWQGCYGGSGADVLKNVIRNQGGTFTAVGSTSSANIGTAVNKGGADAWVIKFDIGLVQFSRVFGGSKDEEALSVQETPDNGFLVTGYSESTDGNVTGSNGKSDMWSFRLSSTGNLVWQKCFGTGRDEFGIAGIPVSEKDFILAGFGLNGQKDYYGTPKSSGILVKFIGNYNTIKGTLFTDANLNGVKDAGEIYFEKPLLVTSQKGKASFSNISDNGRYQNFVDTGSYTTAVNFNKPYYTVLPSSISSNFSTYFNTDSISFALQPIPNMKDLAVSLIDLTPARPGFDASYQLQYRNVGTTTITAGEVLLKKDSRTSILSASPAVHTAIGDTLKWNFTNLQPGDTASIVVNLKIAAPPAVNNGDTLSYLAIINPVSGDETPLDNTARLRQIVIGSYDPNDKAESNGGSIPLSFITAGNALQYTIRFQNTGTDTAFNIVVRDTLSNRLEHSTLEMVAASHPYTLNVENGVNLAWNFPNILLPDSNRNEPASHGYIVYRIKPKSDLAKGETIHNTASIYFDFNLPIVTNDAATVVQADMVTLPQSLLHFYGNLQNGSVQLTWKTAPGDGIKRFEIERNSDGKNYHQIGTRVAAPGANEYSFTDPVAGLPGAAFSYRLKLLQESGGISFSNSLLFRVKNSASGAMEIYPNPAKKQGWMVYTSATSGKGILQVLNAAGAVVGSQQVAVQQGRNVYSLAGVAAFSPGIYTVRLIAGAEVSSRSFVLQ